MWKNLSEKGSDTMDQDNVRFEDIDPNDLEARLDAAKKEFEPLLKYINESLKKISLEYKEKDRRSSDLSDAYQGHILRGFDATARTADMIEMHDKVVENSGYAARKARKESDDLNQKYGKYVKK